MSHRDTEVPPLPLLLTIGATLAVSTLTNCALLAALFKRHRNGLESLLVQLSITDVAQTATRAVEIWTYNTGSWSFGAKACSVFRGFYVLLTTASIYLTIIIALHSIAVSNAEQEAAKLINEKSDINKFDEEERSSRHSLMANSDTSTPPRNMHMGYAMLTHSRSRVMVPSALVWILSVSLSVPEFILSTSRASNGVDICSLVDAAFQMDIATIIAATFNLFVPIIALTIISVLLVRKIKSAQLLISDKEVVAALSLSLYLCLVFFIMCVFNLIVTVINYYSTFLEDERMVLALRPLGLASSSMYLLATIVRPIVVINVIPRLQEVFNLRPKST